MMPQQSTDQSSARPRLHLVTPPVRDVAFAPLLTDALDAGEVAAVLVRLPHAHDQVLVDHVKALAVPVQSKGAALLIDGHPELVAPCGADGTHSNRIAVRTHSKIRPSPEGAVTRPRAAPLIAKL